MTTAVSTPARRRSFGLSICQLAVPALAIPSAMGVAKFFSVADGADHWTTQGVIAAAGFELMNVGLSVLDIRRPELHPTVQRVRFWSVTTAILLNTIAHYGVRVPGLDRIDVIGALLALVASVPLAVLYVALAGLLHAISEGEHTEAAAHASLHAELASAREELASHTRGLARANADLVRVQGEARETEAQLSEELARIRAEARDGSQGLAADLARVQAELAVEGEQLARVQREAREELRAARESHSAELREARGVAAKAREEAQRLAREVEELRRELVSARDRSRDSLMREAQQLQAERGWGASAIGRHLGWPESTVRGWLPTGRTASAAD